MTDRPQPTELPPFLQNPDAFSVHLDDRFRDRSNMEKGDGFASFACKVLPLCDFWGDMPSPQLSSKKSHDGGIDLSATHPTRGHRYLAQAKFRMREVADLDGVISKFHDHERRGATAGEPQSSLFSQGADDGSVYILVTATDLTEIRRRYEASQLPSLSHYRALEASQRLEILDGPRLLRHLQALYRQSFIIQPEIDIRFAAEILHVGSVFISVVSGRVLRGLFAANGSSLFFENIREFLGIADKKSDVRGGVNDAITETLQRCPEKMLGRNNGITFRADQVTQVDTTTLRLTGGSIVNGCQTTMCVVHAGEVADSARIAVKVVVGEDSWDVAKSANYQNQVSRIDLELARFLRPQVVRKITLDLGYGVPSPGEANIASILDEIHQTKISYDALKLLYIGLFSRFPSNIFEGHYSEVRLDVLNAASAGDRQAYVMEVLVRLLMQMRDASEEFKRRHSGEVALDLFKRFFREEEPRYNCLLGLLTASGCVDDDLAPADSENDGEKRWARLHGFLGRLETVLARHPEHFNRVFRHAVVTLTTPVIAEGANRDDMLKRMSSTIQSHAGTKYRHLVMSLRMHMGNDDWLVERPIDFGDASPRTNPSPPNESKSVRRGR